MNGADGTKRVQREGAAAAALRSSGNGEGAMGEHKAPLCPAARRLKRIARVAPSWAIDRETAPRPRH